MCEIYGERGFKTRINIFIFVRSTTEEQVPTLWAKIILTQVALQLSNFIECQQAMKHSIRIY